MYWIYFLFTFCRVKFGVIIDEVCKNDIPGPLLVSLAFPLFVDYHSDLGDLLIQFIVILIRSSFLSLTRRVRQRKMCSVLLDIRET